MVNENMQNFQDNMQDVMPKHTSDTIRVMFDPKKLTDLIIHGLKHEEYVVVGEETIGGDTFVKKDWRRPKGVNPELNEDGMFKVKNILQSHLGYNISLSNYSEADIDEKVFRLKCDLDRLFGLYYVKYKMNKETRFQVKENIVTVVESELRRALHGMGYSGLTEQRIQQSIEDKREKREVGNNES